MVKGGSKLGGIKKRTGYNLLVEWAFWRVGLVNWIGEVVGWKVDQV